MREWAAVRGVFILGLTDRGTWISAVELERNENLVGHVDQIWSQIETMTVHIANPSRLVAANEDVKARYFTRVAAVAEMVDAARHGVKYPYGPAEVRNRVLPGVQSIYGIRDAAIAEARDRLGTARAKAFSRLIVALAIVGLAATVVGSAAWLFSRRVVTPLVALTRVISRLADGDLTVQVDGSERRDEIGAHASALGVLKSHAIAKRRMEEDERSRQEELRKTTESLRRSQEHLARAQRIAGMGSDVRKLATDIAEWSDESYRIFGVTRETFTPTSRNLLSQVHPDDRPTVSAMRERANQGICPPPFEYRRPPRWHDKDHPPRDGAAPRRDRQGGVACRHDP
jgi:HAMP domain-containing protein